jgi:hypothetical protein
MPRKNSSSGPKGEIKDERAAKEERAAKDKRIAEVLWWVLMAMRFVIPAYLLYVVYYYWTSPFNPHMQGPAALP